MAWIESHQELARHPKTKKLARKLGTSIPAVIGHLHLMWWWAMDYAQDGDLSRYENEDIADALCWEEDATQLVEALHDAGFIDQREDGTYEIHDWQEYGGKMFEKRAEEAERKRKARQEKTIRKTSKGSKKTSSGRPADILKTAHVDNIRKDNITGENITAGEEAPAPVYEPSNLSKHETIGDAYTHVFGGLIMKGPIRDFVLGLKDKGVADDFIIEVILETGESASNPNVRYMQTVAESWIQSGISSREEAKRAKSQGKIASIQRQSKTERTSNFLKQSWEDCYREESRDSEIVHDHPYGIPQLRGG